MLAEQIRLSVTLEDLTVYVAQHADKQRESMIRQLSAPVDGVKEKLGEIEETLAGFQRTMHLVLSEVDADRERSAAIAVSSHIHREYLVGLLRHLSVAVRYGVSPVSHHFYRNLRSSMRISPPTTVAYPIPHTIIVVTSTMQLYYSN